MNTAHFTFYGDLNDFLAHKYRNTTFAHNFEERASIKDMIEALGVPHTEIEALLVNKQAVDFGYLVADGDNIEVYSVKTLPADLTFLALRPPLPAETRFVLDTHLGQLAVYLRMLGFDTLYRNDYTDEELARISSSEGRLLLTRDKGLLKRAIVIYGYFMRETNPQKQVVEILSRYKLVNKITPLRRCIRCNGQLQPVSKAEIAHRLEAKTSQFYDEFSVCTSCDQIYWKGTHYDNMRRLIADLAGENII